MEAKRTSRGRLALAVVLAICATALAGPGSARAALPPQGIYEGCAPRSTTVDCNQRLQKLASAGFKYVLNYSAWYGSAAQVRGYADRAAALGMQVIWPLNHRAWRDEGELAATYPSLAQDCGCDTNEEFRRFAVELVKDHPASWGFYVGDEQDPTPENVDAVTALSQEVKQLAPSKPTLFVTLPYDDLSGRLAPFLPAADVGGTDYYPIGLEPDLSRFPAIAAENRQVNQSHGTDSAIVLQAFSWAQYHPSAYPGARFPTRSEMQKMRDLAITHGEPGMLFWYAYQDIVESSNPAGNWANLKAAAFAPHIEVSGVPTGCGGRRAKLGVRVRANSAVRKLKVMVDGKVRRRTARASTGISLRPLRPGLHKVRVIATDRSGKQSVLGQRVRRCA